ncbi:angio-associated migratory cell protein [Condylostylus longicornis]|uniref:angio-associated migratory cell protein n=1 Tax=Condylostylus longicornis TaxID=2530218 RepID=UPI00244E467A|nr:angio-associated migratory cell protein [Condylostylus longicornis]
MRDNTPPRMSDISDEDGELIYFDDEHAPEEDFEEINEDELLEIANSMPQSTIEDEGDNAIGEKVPEEDHSILTFSKHNLAVFCCSLHPSKPWAVSGSEDDKAYVWNRNTGEVVQEITGHKDSVIAASFSSDGNYLATGDMAGEIFCFKISGDEEIKKVWEYSMGDMGWMMWHRAANILLAGSSVEGEIYVWRIPSGDCKVLPGNGEKCETAELTADGKKLFAGYGGGTVKLWDIKSNTVTMEVNKDHHMGHKDGVSSVSCDSDNPMYISGGEDGKILFTNNNGAQEVIDTGESVESVAFSPYPDLKIVASGTLQGQIAIWDYSKHTLRTTCEHPEPDDGITTLKFLPDYVLVVGTIQGNIYGYDVRNGQRKFTLSGHAAEIYDIQYDTNENVLVTASEDHTVKIFRCPG